LTGADVVRRKRCWLCQSHKSHSTHDVNGSSASSHTHRCDFSMLYVFCLCQRSACILKPRSHDKQMLSNIVVQQMFVVCSWCWPTFYVVQQCCVFMNMFVLCCTTCTKLCAVIDWLRRLNISWQIGRRCNNRIIFSYYKRLGPIIIRVQELNLNRRSWKTAENCIFEEKVSPFIFYRLHVVQQNVVVCDTNNICCTTVLCNKC